MHDDPIFVKLSEDQLKLVVSFNYDPYRNLHYVELIKMIPERRWDSQTLTWSMPNTPESRQLLAQYFPDQLTIESDYFDHTISELELEMKRRLYSRKSIRSYLAYNKNFLRFSLLLSEEIKNQISKTQAISFIDYLVGQRKLSSSSVNLAISSLKFLFMFVLKKQPAKFHRPSKDKILPAILSELDVKKILNATSNIKHKTLLAITYSAGLRVSEVVRLKLPDLDINRKMICVKQSKGRKDRYTLLSDRVIKLVNNYKNKYKLAEKDWLFPGQYQGKHLSVRSAEKIFTNSVSKAGIHKNVSIHALRHAFATHLLENGTDIRYIQSLLGHASSKTTEIYTKVSMVRIQNIKNPIDKIDEI